MVLCLRHRNRRIAAFGDADDADGIHGSYLAQIKSNCRQGSVSLDLAVRMRCYGLALVSCSLPSSAGARDQPPLLRIRTSSWNAADWFSVVSGKRSTVHAIYRTHVPQIAASGHALPRHEAHARVADSVRSARAPPDPTTVHRTPMHAHVPFYLMVHRPSSIRAARGAGLL